VSCVCFAEHAATTHSSASCKYMPTHLRFIHKPIMLNIYAASKIGAEINVLLIPIANFPAPSH